MELVKVKGVFAKNERGYRLNAIKLLKTTNTEDATFNSDRKQTIHSDITNSSHRLSFDAFVYS